MPRPRKNPPPPKRPVGRPPKYDEHTCDQARKLCRLGATNEDLARFFEVPLPTLLSWVVDLPEFSSALKEGRELADALVGQRLFERATGYRYKAKKVFGDPKSGEHLIVEYEDQMPPDTTACIFWLKNRRPDLWRDRHHHEVTGKGGGPVDVRHTDAELAAKTDKELEQLAHEIDRAVAHKGNGVAKH